MSRYALFFKNVPCVQGGLCSFLGTFYFAVPGLELYVRWGLGAAYEDALPG